MHDILLMRHGETVWNREGRMQGHLNSGLTDKGMAQAHALAELLAERDLSGWRLVSSPSGRALCTAGIALGSQAEPIRTDDRLMEIDIGEWSGRLHPDLRAEHPELFTEAAGRFAWYDAAPGGEGFAGLRARCEAFLDEMTGPTVVVTHGITLRMLRSLVLAGDDSLLAAEGRIRQGVIYAISDKTCTEIEKL